MNTCSVPQPSPVLPDSRSPDRPDDRSSAERARDHFTSAITAEIDAVTQAGQWLRTAIIDVAGAGVVIADVKLALPISATITLLARDWVAFKNLVTRFTDELVSWAGDDGLRVEVTATVFQIGGPTLFFTTTFCELDVPAAEWARLQAAARRAA